MAHSFITEDFLLRSKTARALYHEHARNMPIYDYHCHLPADRIASDHQFENLAQIWLYGDHYKWRAMRANGVDERYCTGDASDYDKFVKWAQTVPYTIRNPLYHWTHLELERHFGVRNLLNGDTAKKIYETCSEMLRGSEFSIRGILRKMNVKLVCTTEGPFCSLDEHRKIAQDGFEIKVNAAFRPDKSLAVENAVELNAWIDKLEEVCDMQIADFRSYIEALRRRHSYFHEHGCRLSDYGLERVYCEDYKASEIKSIFDKIRTGSEIDELQQEKFRSAMLYELVLMDYHHNWVMQLHLGALRNVNSRMLKKLGSDCGFDSIGDLEMARPLAKFLDRMDSNGQLPKTLLYNLNPKDNAVMAAMIGCFQGGSVPGKIQFGSGWWFLDQKDGIEQQIEALSNMGLLSRFVGMLTDSRSFLSYPRHEYFRRVLCQIIGSDVEAGLLPEDMDLLGQIVEDICFNNAAKYFAMELG